MTLRDTPSIVTPAGVAGLEFRDEADTVNALVPVLRRQGIKAIVVLVHQGGFQGPNTSPAGAPANTFINDCQGALVDAANCTLPNSTGRGIPVTQASAFGRALTAIDLTARSAGTGMLLDEHRALVPAAGVRDARHVWVRDGLGRRRAAKIQYRLETLDLVVLRLVAPLFGPAPARLAPLAPFAGSPALGAAHTPGIEPAWPLLRVGFHGPSNADGLALALELPAGSPVFAMSGHLTGVVLRAPGDRRG
jgi:hypothetical protein